ncbi:MAG: hypothetical protein AAFR47_09395 [Pseudomonadota bacterium]
MAFLIAALLLAFFVANVTVGAVTGTPWIGNVAEAIVLFGSSIAFVAGILKREADAAGRSDD